MLRPASRFKLFAAALLACGFLAQPVRAQSTIKQPGQRTHYYFEVEPHLLLGLLDPPGFGEDAGFGAGFRGTIDIAPGGFLPKLNDSVGIGFGLDYVRYDGWQGRRGVCEEFVSGPSGTRICVQATDFDDVDYFYLPVVMQWNFWLHRRWSVFGEPGVALYVEEGDVEFTPFVLYAGGRFHVTERISLTMRLGYPTFSLGVSFLL